MSRLAGRVALVTGAAQGMGASHVRRLVAEGARVLVTDIADDVAQSLVDSVGRSAAFRHLDVVNTGDWSDAVTAAVETFGSLDVLVNNAGILETGPLEKYSVEAFRRSLDVNLVGSFNGIRAVIGAMRGAGGGSIINISSTAGLTGYHGQVGYVASKWGLRGLTKAAAMELAQYGIRVNSVHPGAVRTPMTTSIQALASRNPMKRLAEADEISSLVVFLAGEESRFSTGAEFIVDGGLTQGLPPLDFVPH